MVPGNTDAGLEAAAAKSNLLGVASCFPCRIEDRPKLMAGQGEEGCRYRDVDVEPVAGEIPHVVPIKKVAIEVDRRERHEGRKRAYGWQREKNDHQQQRFRQALRSAHEEAINRRQSR